MSHDSQAIRQAVRQAARQSPKEAFEAAEKAILDQIEKLKAGLKKERQAFEKEGGHWGHVGDLTHVLHELTDINKFIHNEAE
jgi:hypothetical protein